MNSQTRRRMRRAAGMKRMPELEGEGEPCKMCLYLGAVILGKHAENFKDPQGRGIGLVIGQAGQFVKFVESEDFADLCQFCAPFFMQWLGRCEQVHRQRHGQGRIVVPTTEEASQALLKQIHLPGGQGR